MNIRNNFYLFVLFSIITSCEMIKPCDPKVDVYTLPNAGVHFMMGYKGNDTLMFLKNKHDTLVYYGNGWTQKPHNVTENCECTCPSGEVFTQGREIIFTSNQSNIILKLNEYLSKNNWTLNFDFSYGKDGNIVDLNTDTTSLIIACKYYTGVHYSDNTYYKYFDVYFRTDKGILKFVYYSSLNKIDSLELIN